MPRGAFIVIEGLDRSGKTTQVTRLAEVLRRQGLSVEQMRFPDRTTSIGRMINSYLQSTQELEDHTIHLLFSSNRWEAASKIEALVKAGTTVICDRYHYSGQVYSVAKHNPTLDMTWARSPDVGLPAPDKVIFLNVSEEEAARRGGFGDEKYETVELQRRVRHLFAEIQQSEGATGGMITVNAEGTADDVARNVLELASSTIAHIATQLSVLQRVQPWQQSS